MAAKGDVDNKLTKNLATDPNLPQNEGALYIVRHGKTKLNNSDASIDNSKIRGWLNVPLDKEGKQEARTLGQIFKGHAPDKLYSSDLKRARDTADQISLATKIPVISKFDLRPWNLGVHQGKSASEVGPAIQESAMKTPHTKVKGGESFNNFKTRALTMAKKLLSEAKDGKKVVAVTHTRVAKLIQAWIAAGCPDDNSIDHNEFMKDTIKTGSIHKIEPTENGVKVTEIENLQQSSIDNTAVSSKEVQGGNTKMENEIQPEVKATVEETQAVAQPIVEATPAIEDTVVEVEDGEALEAEELLEVSKTLKAEDRNALKNNDFAVVKTVKDKNGTKTIRKYPIHDKAHVQNALARLHQGPSREGLKKLGVDPDSVITKVKAQAKKLGMEEAEIQGYCTASQGSDMQKVIKRGKDDVQDKTSSTSFDGKNSKSVVSASAEPEVAKKVKSIKTGDDSVEGLTPDQVNQMQNQLFANIKSAMKFRKYHKQTMKNIKSLKKAMMDGVYASVEPVKAHIEDFDAMNMDIDGKKTTTVTDVGTGEKVTEAVTVGKAPVPVADCIEVDNNDGKEPKALAEALIPAAPGEKVEVIIAPATPVANDEVKSVGETKTDVLSDGEAKPVEVITPAGDAKAVVDLNQNLEAEKLAKELIPTVPGEALKPGTCVEPIMAPAAEVVNMEITSKGTETTVSTVSDTKVEETKGTGSDVKVETVEVTPAVTDTEILKASVESLQKEIESQKEKIAILETSAVKLIERKKALGEFGKDLSDKDILDDDKFEVAKIKAENKALKHELNTSSAHLAETSSVRGEDETKDLQAKIRAKAQKLY
jgi:broad specificity phosphatase PhoE